MRKEYKLFTKTFLKNEFRNAKVTFDLTLEQMAEELRLSTRQCSNLLSGSSGFGMESLIRFLVFVPEEYAVTLLRKYRKLLSEREENESLTPRKKKDDK